MSEQKAPLATVAKALLGNIGLQLLLIGGIISIIGSLLTGTDSFVSFILNLIKANATPANNTNIELVAITIKCLNPPVQARMKEKRHNVNMAIYGVVYFDCTLANTLGKDPLKPPAKSTREKAMVPVNKLPNIEKSCINTFGGF